MYFLNSKRWRIIAICIAVVIALVIIAVFVLQPSGGVKIVKGWKPAQASREVEPYAERAIEIIDDYLHFRLTVDEAEDSFEELSDRIDKLGITYDSKGYTNADDVVNHCITYLHIDARELSESEFWEYRDLLAFQIGETVEGETYPAKQNYFDEKDRLCETYFGMHISNADQYSAYSSDDYISLFVDFDYINGVSIDDVYKALEYAQQYLTKDLPGKSHQIMIGYKYYGQDVFYVSMLRNDEIVSFTIVSAPNFHEASVEEMQDREMEYEANSLEALKIEMERMTRAFNP